MYKVIILDTDTHHEVSHVVRCHGGTDFWIIMCFASDCMVMTKSGLKRARPGDCFIKSPDFIEYHYTPKDCSDGFINDWIHLSSEDLWEDMQELQLPVNELIHTGQPLLLRSSLSKIIQEKNGVLPFWERKCSNLTEGLLIRLAKVFHETQNTDTKQYGELLLGLRNYMQEHLEEEWSVARMAEEVGLSSSRFSVLYKKRFGRSPNEDLIEMRLEKAKLLLIATNRCLQDIAQTCGFQNEYYFSRVFKSRENVTPGNYRREF